MAEGNGKFSRRDRARFFDIARGSALESAAALDVLVARKLTTLQAIAPAKEQLLQVVNMLMGLLKSLGYAFETTKAIVREEPGSEYGSKVGKSRSKRKSKRGQ